MKNMDIVVIFIATGLFIFFILFSLIEDIKIKKNISKIVKNIHPRKQTQKTRKVLFKFNKK